MRLALLADIHSNLPALEAVLERIAAYSPDLIISAGDLVGYNTFPNECIELARKLKFYNIIGNHEYATITGHTEWFNPVAAKAIEWTRSRITKENLEFLKTFELIGEFSFGGKKIKAVHGSPASPLKEYIMPNTPVNRLKQFLGGIDILVLGHTHFPMTIKIGSKWVINPGSVGQPRDGVPKASFTILDVSKGKVRNVRVRYDIEKTAKAIIKEKLPEELAHRLYMGR